MMPKQVKNKQIVGRTIQREDVDYYHDELKYMIKTVGYWSHGSIELQEFLDQCESKIVSEPDEFRDFCENWESVRCAGVSIGMHQHLHPKNLRTLARALHASMSRQKYYIKLINSRLRCASAEQVNPLPIVELEQRYQFHLYKKSLKSQGLKLEHGFDDWRDSGGCVTFYDMPLRCLDFRDNE